ncbi:MAG: putative mutT-NUDIX hydrolase [Pseudonocardia sp.]|nr:putative mutT-NUDIX hydrolase [Pseudonocardia sp.]
MEPGRAGSGAAPVRHVHFRDPDAPTPTVVTPSVFVAVQGSLLLVRRRDSGAWELPGGRVGIGESAVVAAVRETAEESGLRVQITGLVGLFTDPAHVVRAAVGGEIRQQFVVVLHGWAARDRPARTGTRSSTPPGSPRRLSQR